MATYPLGAGQYHPPDTAVLLYRYLDVGVETRVQSADADVYADRNTHNSTSHHGYPPGRSADRDVDGDRHPMVPAHSHPYVHSGAHSGAICYFDAHPLSHGDAHTHANGHSHGHPSADGNACANRGPHQHIDQHAYIDSDEDAYGYSHTDTGANYDQHAHPHSDPDPWIHGDHHFDHVIVIDRHNEL